MAMGKFSQYSTALPLLCARIPIPSFLLFPRQRRWTVDGPDADKSEWINLEFLIDPDNPALGSKCQQFAISKDGYSEDWTKWAMAFSEIENLMPMKEPADKIGMFRTLFKGQALSYFEHHLMRRFESEDSDVPDNVLIELVLRELYIGLEYIPKRQYTYKSIIWYRLGVYLWVLIHPYNNL
jgi:hypothetical protein